MLRESADFTLVDSYSSSRVHLIKLVIDFFSLQSSGETTYPTILDVVDRANPLGFPSFVQEEHDLFLSSLDSGSGKCCSILSI